MKSISQLRTLPRLFSLVLLGTFLMACVAVSAQSGRRPRKPSAPAVVETAPSPTPTPTPKPKPSLLLNVGMDDRAGFVNMPLNYYSEALHTLIERLSRDVTVKVNDAGTHLSRADAVKMAKAEKEGFVVYIQLRVDKMDPDAFSQDPRDVIVEYYVFAPATGETVHGGHTYARSYQNKSVIRPGSTGTLNNYMINQAAVAAAEQILSYFKNRKPPVVVD